MTEPKRGRRQRPGRDDGDAGNDSLRAILQQGDPDRDGRVPSIAERAALRRLVTDVAGSASSRTWGPVPAFGSALIVVVVLAVASLFWFRPTGDDSPPRVAGRVALDQPAAGGAMIDRSPDDGAGAFDRSPAGAGVDPAARIDADARPAIRNVQFVTPGGTRIVWVLNRNLDI